MVDGLIEIRLELEGCALIVALLSMQSPDSGSEFFFDQNHETKVQIQLNPLSEMDG